MNKFILIILFNLSFIICKSQVLPTVKYYEKIDDYNYYYDYDQFNNILNYYKNIAKKYKWTIYEIDNVFIFSNKSYSITVEKYCTVGMCNILLTIKSPVIVYKYD